MYKQATVARSLHDLGLGAWFGGSLMGAVGLNGASADLDDPRQRLRVANAGWARWTPVNAAAIAAHLIGGVPITWSNKARLAAQPQARWVNTAKGALTLAALAVTAYARYMGTQLGRQGETSAAPVQDATSLDVQAPADATTPDAETPPDAAQAQRRLAALQWMVPALTGGLLVVNAKAGEQQRPVAVFADALRSRVAGMRPIVPMPRVPSGGLPALLGVIAAFGAIRRLRRRSGGRHRRAEHAGIRVRDIMTSSPEIARERDTLEAVARKLASSDIGSVPVCGDDNRLKGMITDRDIVMAVVSTGRDARTTTAGELANGTPVTIGADDPITAAIDVMKRHKVRRLPVIDDQRLVGIVSQADVAAAARDEHVGDLVEAISV